MGVDFLRASFVRMFLSEVKTVAITSSKYVGSGTRYGAYVFDYEFLDSEGVRHTGTWSTTSAKTVESSVGKKIDLIFYPRNDYECLGLAHINNEAIFRYLAGPAILLSGLAFLIFGIARIKRNLISNAR